MQIPGYRRTSDTRIPAGYQVPGYQETAYTAVMHFSEISQHSTSLKSVSQQGEKMVKSMMARNHKMYGIHNLKFKSIDAEEMRRNESGAVMREVTVDDIVSSQCRN